MDVDAWIVETSGRDEPRPRGEEEPRALPAVTSAGDHAAERKVPAKPLQPTRLALLLVRDLQPPIAPAGDATERAMLFPVRTGSDDGSGAT